MHSAQVLEALKAGRVAVSANPTAPAVIPIEDQIGVVDGEGCVLTSPSGVKKIIRKDIETFAGERGIYTLQDDRGKYQALGYIS